MATLQDIMAMLRNMRDTKAETGRVGMEAMKYQGDKYKQVGDRLNSMVGTWVGRAEKQADRGLAASEGAADRAQRQAEADKNYLFNTDKLNADEALRRDEAHRLTAIEKYKADKELEGRRVAANAGGSGGKEKTASDYPASLMKLSFSMEGGFDPVNEGLNWETVKKDPQRAISTYDALIKMAVMDGMDKDLGEEYKALFRSQLNQYIKGAGGPGPDADIDITEDTGAPLMDRFTKAPEGKFAEAEGEGGAAWRYPNPAFKADIPEPPKFAEWDKAGRPATPGKRRSGVEFTEEDIKNFLLFLRSTGRK